MNLKHPYEKHLAEKLVQVPPPGDPDQNWQQMKALLDEDMPRGGGGWPGASRWIIPGIIILAIGTGIWVGGRQFLPFNKGGNSMAGTINKTHGNKPVDPNKKSVTANQTTVPAGTTAAANNTVTPSETNHNELVAGTTPAIVNDKELSEAVKEVKEKEFTRQQNKEKPPVLAAVVTPNATTPKAETPKAERSTTAPPATAPAPTKRSNNNEINADRKKVYTAKKNNKKKRNTNSKGNRSKEHFTNDVTKAAAPKPKPVVIESNDAAIDPQMVITNEEGEEDNRFVSLPTVRVHKPTTRPVSNPLTSVKERPVDIIVDYTGTSTITPSGVLQRNYTFYSQADLFPNMSVAQKKSGSRKSGRGYEGYEGRSFALGLSLPLGFPLGDQEPLAYNRQAGANTISDYIPSPHFQYHVNHRTYFQTQIQFSSPQFIRPILLYRTSEATATTNVFIDNSVFARKLYYFNLPVSVYHSPMRNFYMGTGLQFSSMISGVAQSEQRRRNSFTNEDVLLNQRFSRFGNDSLSRRFNNSEVRLLLDMNYFWNRFVVGLQYNQAFNNYVSFQMNSTSPYTFDKNKALQFYLRYNIWEDKKRKPKGGTLLSLK